MYKFRVTDVITRSNNNISIQFEDISGRYPIYKAGQFVTLCFLFGDREVRRSYSFSSSPDVNEPLEITVKRVDNGEISRLLHHKVVKDDIIDVLEPQGLFVYEPEIDIKRTVFLFAAGVGITPLFSILKTALTTESQSKIVLIYSNSSKESTLFYDELLNWQAEYPDRFSIEFIWSEAKNLLKARLNREYLIDLVNHHKVDNTENVFYTCGPLFYMDLVRFTLLGMGFAENSIKRETFHFPEEEEDDDERDFPVVDGSNYNVLIKFAGLDYSLQVPSNKTILDVALENKIKLPYSCKSGMCSTCISQVVDGAVRMDYNEVLTDREVDNGRCLICTSHPIVDNTIIEIL